MRCDWSVIPGNRF